MVMLSGHYWTRIGMNLDIESFRNHYEKKKHAIQVEYESCRNDSCATQRKENLRKKYQKVKKVLAMNEMEMAKYYHQQAEIFNERRRAKRNGSTYTDETADIGITAKELTGKTADQRPECSKSAFKVSKQPKKQGGQKSKSSGKVAEEMPTSTGLDDGFILPTQECVYNPNLGIFEEISGHGNDTIEESEVASGSSEMEEVEKGNTEMKAIPAGDVFDPDDRFWAPPADKVHLSLIFNVHFRLWKIKLSKEFQNNLKKKIEN